MSPRGAALALAALALLAAIPLGGGAAGVPACAARAEELRAAGLPVGEATESVLYASHRERRVHPPAEGFVPLALAAASRADLGSAEDALSFDERRMDVCLAQRAETATLRATLDALALGVRVPGTLLDLTREGAILVVVETDLTRRVALDRHVVEGFLLLPPGDADWNDLIDLSESRETTRVVIHAASPTGREDAIRLAHEALGR